MNAIFYVVKSGCQWRMLPKDFPSWKSVYSFYKRIRDRGILDKILYDLVETSRLKKGRNANPSYCIIDSQSVKNNGMCEDIGIDGGKKNQGS